ncbi:MAG: hypothetical protein ACRDPY_21185 [Streptosporangiaceae bacterium]
MNHTRPRTGPADPVMAAADPALFTPLTGAETEILCQHLTSGWYKQAAVYPVLSEPWRETRAMLSDLHQAWQQQHRARQAEQEPDAGTEPDPEPEAG